MMNFHNDWVTKHCYVNICILKVNLSVPGPSVALNLFTISTV